MTQLSSNKTKLAKVHVYSTLTQQNTLQNYLPTIFNRDEIIMLTRRQPLKAVV